MIKKTCSLLKKGISLFTVKFFIINLFGFILIALATFQGWLQYIYLGDITQLSILISTLSLFGLYLVYKKKWDEISFVANSHVVLGLIGTIIGIVIALKGVDPEAITDPSKAVLMITSLIKGISVAIHTTLVGTVGYFWLTLNVHLLYKHRNDK